MKAGLCRGRSKAADATVAYKILYSGEALVELETPIDYIRAGGQRSAERFGTALLNHIELLQEFPRLGLPVLGRSMVRRIFHSPVRVSAEFRAVFDNA